MGRLFVKYAQKSKQLPPATYDNFISTAERDDQGRVKSPDPKHHTHNRIEPTMPFDNENASGTYYRHNPTLRGFVDAMLWASNDESNEQGGEPLDRNYGREDIAPNTLRRIAGFIANFHDAAQTQFPEGTPTHDDGSELGSEQGGHDLFLTAAGHGVGFWDGDWGDDGDTLTEIVKAIGGRDIEYGGPYIGDDGMIYIHGWES